MDEKLVVQGKEISLFAYQENDYLSLTDMVKDTENGLSLMRNGFETRIP